MNKIEKVKKVLEKLGCEAETALEELMPIYKSGEINAAPNRDGMLKLIHACQDIISCNRFFGMSEAERIIEATGDAPIPLAIKKYLGIEGCLE